jgi:hypothetical protein
MLHLTESVAGYAGREQRSEPYPYIGLIIAPGGDKAMLR